MEEDEHGVVYPQIDRNNCIECHSCEKICPVLNPPASNEPQHVFASWSLDDKERLTSASGGVAYELYRYAVSKGFYVVGASINDDFSVSLKIGSSYSEIAGFKNSKYVFSQGYEVFSQIRDLLKKGEKILIAALPCQIAAYKKAFKNYEKIIFVEILCHGTTPYSYLYQHLHTIEQETGKKASKISFRDPRFGTSKYTFTVYDANNNLIYAKRTADGDKYQYGYHRGITYRENCYQCPFAKSERVGDIILCDYYGLGKKFPCEYDMENVSCIITNTPTGMAFVKDVADNRNIFVEERPIEEAVEGNPRLRIPPLKTYGRRVFEQLINNGAFDFDRVMEAVMSKTERKNRLTLVFNQPKRILFKLFSRFFNK